jgi:hypothetical protein
MEQTIATRFGSVQSEFDAKTFAKILMISLQCRIWCSAKCLSLTCGDIQNETQLTKGLSLCSGPQKLGLPQRFYQSVTTVEREKMEEYYG